MMFLFSPVVFYKFFSKLNILSDLNAEARRCEDMKMWKCENVEMWKCGNVAVAGGAQGLVIARRSRSNPQER
jgi:hypothetical protein